MDSEIFEKGNCNARSGSAWISGLLILASSPALAQTSGPGADLESMIAELRGCVRAGAPEARAAGVAFAEDVRIFFGPRCLPSIGQLMQGKPIAHPQRMPVAVPPGLFWHVIQDEWAAAQAGRQ
jgi:hypothetical protein